MIDEKLLKKKPGRKVPVWGVIYVLVGACLFAVLVPNFIRARARGQLTACKSNLKNVSNALEVYYYDHKAYPRTLDLLTPGYLQIIPTCAGAGRDTYSDCYRTTGDKYTFFCGGLNHSSANEPTNYPQYNSTQGLVT